jgi:hypothetical protein
MSATVQLVSIVSKHLHIGAGSQIWQQSPLVQLRIFYAPSHAEVGFEGVDFPTATKFLRVYKLSRLVSHLAYSISPFPLLILFSSSHCSQFFASSSCFFSRSLLLVLIIPTLVPLPPRKYILFQITSLASNLLNYLKNQRGARCLFVYNFGQ